MLTSPLPKEIAEAATEFEHAYEESDDPKTYGDHKHYFMAGVEWLWNYLSEQSPEFDTLEVSRQSVKSAENCFGDGKMHRQLGFREGACWQFEQMKQRLTMSVRQKNDTP